MTATKNGADALTKPINKVALIAGVERALDLNRTKREETFEHSPPGSKTGVTSCSERSAEQAGCWRIEGHPKPYATTRNTMQKMEVNSFAALAKIAGAKFIGELRILAETVYGR
jgi:hypothetical protein